ncbi:MAG: ACT domain-containing protein [Clostridia bacterium]
MKAIITVIGKDTTGIIAKISAKCFEHGVNILDITQKVLDDTFAMIMMINVTNLNIGFKEFIDIMNTLGVENNLDIHTVNEDLFNSMHRI